jgi:hypothetical protein
MEGLIFVKSMSSYFRIDGHLNADGYRKISSAANNCDLW